MAEFDQSYEPEQTHEQSHEQEYQEYHPEHEVAHENESEVEHAHENEIEVEHVENENEVEHTENENEKENDVEHTEKEKENDVEHTENENENEEENDPEDGIPENPHPDEKQDHGDKPVTGGGEKWPGWPGESIFRMLVPAQKVGSIIGRKGEYIKKTCEETKARIKVLDGPPGTRERAGLELLIEEHSYRIGYNISFIAKLK